MKLLLVLSLILSLSSLSSALVEFDFDTDLDGFVSDRGFWRWTDLATLDRIMPDGGNDGLAVMDSNMDSDEMYWPRVEAPYGGEATVTYFARSQSKGTNTFTLRKSYDAVWDAFDIYDFADDIQTYSDEWITRTLTLDPDPVVFYIGFFCYNSFQSDPGEWFLGCALDSMTITAFNESVTTTTQVTTTVPPTTTEGPVATTEEPVVTTEGPVGTTGGSGVTTEGPVGTTGGSEVTTEGPVGTTGGSGATTEGPVGTTGGSGATTEEPVVTTGGSGVTTEVPVGTTGGSGVTTEEPVVTTGGSGVTTEGPVGTTGGSGVTTEEPVGTTEVPVVTTEEPVVTTETPVGTTEEVTTSEPVTYPPGSHGYNFQDGMQGWTLSHMNGASWNREKVDSSILVGQPATGEYILRVNPEELYSGVTFAQSPLLIARSREIAVQITFWMNGVPDYPCELKVRKRNSIDDFDEEPIMSLDLYGTTANPSWIFAAGVGNLTIGDRFVLVLEGALGGENTNSVAVSEIVIGGVLEVGLETSGNYDFEDGLVGFSSGNMDGGRWTLLNYTADGGATGMPKPVNGDMVLYLDKFDLHSGIITIETPPIQVTEGNGYEITFKYWTEGSAVYPVALRIRLKTNGGIYQAKPLINLRDNGAVTHNFWITSISDFTTDIPFGTTYLQLVIEADLGAIGLNQLAFDDLIITSTPLLNSPLN